MKTSKCPICDRPANIGCDLCAKHTLQQEAMMAATDDMCPTIDIIRWVAAKARAYERAQTKKASQ